MGTITIHVDGISRAIAKFEGLAEDVDENMWEVLKRLADIGSEEAQNRFDTWGGVGGNSVTVDVEEYEAEREVDIYAYGEDMDDTNGMPAGNTVVLEEFGAGFAAQDHPLATQYGVYPGQWSKEQGQGQWQRNPEYWVYEEPEDHYNYFTSIDATQGMYQASEKIKKSVKDIVKEVFG